MTGSQFVELMQTLRAVAKAGFGGFAMEVLKVQIDLVVKIGRKMVACVRLPGRIAKTAFA